MENIWDESRIQEYIQNQVEESLTLEYKSAGSLSEKEKSEITKDVSAMANSAGGILIYGVSEFSNKDKKHLPEKIDAVDRSKFAKERLEHIIANIQPKIPNVLIHPVQLTSNANHCVYVVEIPKGTTAHQALNKKFYKRYNFESREMDYHEIIDVMSRQSFPKIKIELSLEFREYIYPSKHGEGVNSEKDATLHIHATNDGGIYAKYVNVSINIPSLLMPIHNRGKSDYTQRLLRNTKKDIIGTKDYGMSLRHNYGPSMYSPMLPGRFHDWEITLFKDAKELLTSDMIIKWEVFADNAPSIAASIPIKDISKSCFLNSAKIN